MEDNKIETTEEVKTEEETQKVEEPKVIEEVKPEVKVPEKPKKVEAEVVKSKKNSNKKVIIAILITALILVGGYYAYQYELDRNQMYYNAGIEEGLLYTQATGKLVFLVGGNLTELTMPDEWKAQIQQYLNQQGGQ